ncbi:MAG TPA: hypothetical protein VGM73_09460 [Candidatus Didemnitutus sp.]|jgi:hypothetical protein
MIPAGYWGAFGRIVAMAVALGAAVGNVALHTGCAQPAVVEPPWVLLVVTVTKFDPDGTLFEMTAGGLPFEKGTTGRGPLALVTVNAPAALAGREFLIALSKSTTDPVGRNARSLTEKGRTVTLGIARRALQKGPREVVEFSELALPSGPARTLEDGSPKGSGS